jgi:hypothetical protein
MFKDEHETARIKRAIWYWVPWGYTNSMKVSFCDAPAEETDGSFTLTITSRQPRCCNHLDAGRVLLGLLQLDVGQVGGQQCCSTDINRKFTEFTDKAISQKV